MLPKYQVNTIYPAILGEGWWTGMPCTIVRLQGCNLKCDFCDTPQAINRRGGETLALNVLYERIKKVHHNRNIVLLTGGEPALQRLDLLVPPLTSLGPVHLETNGTIPIPDTAYFSWITVSPKPNTTLDATALGRADEIKWLVDTKNDVAALCEWLEGKKWVDFKRISLQPLSCDPKATEIAYQACLGHGFRLSIQVHKLIGRE